MYKKCKICDKTIKRNKTENKVIYSKRKYCSYQCYHLSTRNGKIIKCKVCKKPIYVWRKQINKRKYCSYKCKGIDRQLKLNRQCVLCKKTFKICSDYKVKRFCSLKCWGKYRKIHKYFTGNNNKKWKGDNVGYSGLHYWVYRQLGKPIKCKHCGTTNKKLQWANKSHQYKRNINDWLSLCVPCHKKYDLNCK